MKVVKRILYNRKLLNNGGGNIKAGYGSGIGHSYNVYSNIRKRSRNINFMNFNNKKYNLPKFSKQLKTSEGVNSDKLRLLKYFENYNHTNKIENYIYNKNTPYSIIYLYQSDFENGTLRITKPGIYVLQENIEFNPNPNNNSMPTISQHNSGQYLSSGNNPYTLGFFAAITIECDNIILDLNNYTLKQSKLHFLQQRFYSNIEIASSPFIKTQGPGVKFGMTNYNSGNTVLIMNGHIGLSSHHGIHSNLNKNIVLYNLIIHDFQVAGISINGMSNSILYNTIIKNSLKNIPVSFNYSQARFLSFILKTIPTDYSININGTDKTAGDLLDNLNTQLDITKTEFLSGENITSTVFKNKAESTTSDGNMYGIALNVVGVLVNDFLNERPETVLDGISPENENNLIENVRIINIESEPFETVGIDVSGNRDLSGYANNTHLVTGPFGDVLNILDVTENSSLSGSYKPNILSDCQVLLGKYKYENPNTYVGTSYISESVLKWIDGSYTDISYLVHNDNPDILSYKFGIDGMAHILKGNIGLFLSGAKNTTCNNIHISNIYLRGNHISSETEKGKKVYGILNVAGENNTFKYIDIDNDTIISSYGTHYSITQANI